MIQRIQSIYLFCAAIVLLVLPWFFPLFQFEESAIMLTDEPIFLTGFIICGVLSLFTIFRYKNRKQQVVSGRLNIILLFVAFGFMLFHYFNIGGGEPDTGVQFGVTVFLPILAVVFISMANRAIMKDEALVRAADRFR